MPALPPVSGSVSSSYQISTGTDQSVSHNQPVINTTRSHNPTGSLSNQSRANSPISVIGQTLPPAHTPWTGAGPTVQPSPNHDRQKSLTGRIIHLERHDEKRATNLFKLLSGVLFALLLSIPYIAAFAVTGAMSIAFAIVGFSTLARILNPVAWTTAIFQILEVLVLRRIGQSNQLPVYRGMIEDYQGRSYAFKMTGPLKTGNLIQGHRVQLRGKWNRGTFTIKDGQDETTNSDITSTQIDHWKWIFFLMLIIDFTAIITIWTYGRQYWQ
jgi:hypothetical protein